MTYFTVPRLLDLVLTFQILLYVANGAGGRYPMLLLRMMPMPQGNITVLLVVALLTGCSRSIRGI